MFKKLKDKLAEEVKSSPQRIQLFAQAAQAAVTSASSSISDITNSDLFSIGDNDAQQSNQTRLSLQSSPTPQQKMFQDVSLMQSPDLMDLSNENDGHRQRRLSNSSFASDISFRLPSYETPSMYHLQSDMEVSASEADERGFSGGPATLDRVTKEQLYAAYKRTQERYKKYRTQYGDLARHYKLLERENAKARSVLVETQDKALRRISELKEQCTLEQSAKAHLEKALRIEIEERNMKIDALNTKVQLLQSTTSSDYDSNIGNDCNKPVNEPENEVQLVNLSNESSLNLPSEDSGVEAASLNNKIEKMERLLNKYKESLKISKEKNSQITLEIQMMSKEIENKNKQVEDLKTSEEQLNDAKTKIQELKNVNEDLQNQINTFDFTKTKELSLLELDLQKANEEITELRGKIGVFTKREEEYAISLAENKLSIHKELESKEAEIKSLKENLAASKQEIQSLKIVVDDYKNNISVLEEDKNKLSSDCAELNSSKNKIVEMDTHFRELSKKYQQLEQIKTKIDEEYKCLQLQLKQETAEKLAMIDRNLYLETKITQLSEENTKKSTRIGTLENELQAYISKGLDNEVVDTEKNQILGEMNSWKERCGKLELEIQEERDELVKLQTEIEKLLSNHELIQAQNIEFRSKIANLNTECLQQQEEFIKYKTSIHTNIKKTLKELKELRQNVDVTFNETKTNLETHKNTMSSASQNMNTLMKDAVDNLMKDIESVTVKYHNIKFDYDTLHSKTAAYLTTKSELSNELDTLQKENNNLIIKLNDSESEKDSLNENLEKIIYEHKSTLEKMKALDIENELLSKKLKEVEETAQQIQATLENEKMLHLASAEKYKTFEMDNQHLKETVQTLESTNKIFEIEIEKLKQQHMDTLNQLKLNHEEILNMKEEEIEKMYLKDNQHTNTLEQLRLLSNEKNELSDIIKSLESKNNQLVSDIGNLTKEHKVAIEKINEQKDEILNNVQALEKSRHNQISLESEIAQYAMSCDNVIELENNTQLMTEKLKTTEDKNTILNAELEDLKGKYEVVNDRIKEINITLTNKSNECDAKQLLLNDFEESLRILTQENISLKLETANFASNIKKLQSEIDEIKISHTEIEDEKDRLNRVINELESKQKDHNMTEKNDKDSQTETNSDDNVENIETSAVLENKWVMEHKQTMSSTASLNLQKENLDDLYEQYSSLKINNDTLKDENRRLQSDIEGLQSYLTKISKENSVLNDKLRELIATSENSTDNDQLSSDVKELRNEIQIGKEKINDLLRENSLLIEENLELKDQLQSQNYSKATDTKNVSYNEKDLDTIRVKYNDLLETNNQLEKHNVNLEQINKSFNGNMQQLQDKNERLKLSNEKLERRLDEALVSLRHLHSLQENTELEYLRNILYEYLTGSGTHSVTLAKVLAAIVKFDDVQTQMVLQKEKERQGFLRQLGII